MNAVEIRQAIAKLGGSTEGLNLRTKEGKAQAIALVEKLEREEAAFNQVMQDSELFDDCNWSEAIFKEEEIAYSSVEEIAEIDDYEADDIFLYRGRDIEIFKSNNDLYRAKVSEWSTTWQPDRDKVKKEAESFIDGNDNKAFGVVVDGSIKFDFGTLRDAQTLANTYSKEDRQVVIIRDGGTYETVRERSPIVPQVTLLAARLQFTFRWLSESALSPELVENKRLYANGCALFDQTSLKVWAFATPIDALEFLVKSKRCAKTYGCLFERIWAETGTEALKPWIEAIATSSATSFNDIRKTQARLTTKQARSQAPKGFARA